LDVPADARAGVLVDNVVDLVADGSAAAVGAVGIQVTDCIGYCLGCAVRVVDGDGVAADDGSVAGTAGFADNRFADEVVKDTVVDGGIPVPAAAGAGVLVDNVDALVATAGFADTRFADDVPAETDTADDVDAKQDHFFYKDFLDAATH